MDSAANDKRIDYIEFPVKDVELAKRFFGEAFGWTFEDYGPDYSSFHDGRLAGGFRGGETPIKGGPLVVLYAFDLEATLDRVATAGATISAPIFAFPGGRRFHFIEPCGHELAVWSDQ